MTDQEHIKVFLVDDHQIVRDGIRALLNGVDNITIINEASNGLEALRLIRRDPAEVDVVIMDITMPEMDGLEATKQIQKEFPSINVIALTMHEEESYLVNMLQQGALGYILKTAGKAELVHAIVQVASGQSYFDQTASSKLLNYLSSEGKAKKVSDGGKLTAREKEVLLLIAEGLTNTEIAKKLFLSPRTIDTHRRNLLQKLNARNTAGLVRYALTHKL